MAIRYLSGINVDSNTLFVDDANNRVGIGTASPTFKLEVNGGLGAGVITSTSDSIEQIVVRLSSDNNKQFILGRTSTAARIFGVTQNVGYVPLLLNEAGGNVLIGTTTDAGYKLDVNGTGRFSGQLTATIFDSTSSVFRFNGNNALSLVSLGGQSVVKINAAGYWGTQLVGANDQGILVNNAGNVGIGTTNPTVTLEVSGRGLITSSGSSDTFAVTHSSGSGIGVNITKGGNGEGLYVNKTSGTGNAVTIVGTLNATTLVKSGGTSSQYLMADGSVSTLTNPVTGTGTTNYVPKWTSGSAIGNSQIFDNGTNVGIGTTSPNRTLTVIGTKRHERVYAYANNTFNLTNDISLNTLWLHLGTQASFTTDKIYYRVGTSTSEEEGEIIVKNTCGTANIEWHRNSYNVMVTAVKARMQGSCQPCEIWIQVRYGSSYGGAFTNIQWQVQGGTDSNFVTVNNTGTPGTGTNEANIASTDGYIVANSDNQSIGGSLGVGTTSPGSRIEISGTTGSYNSGIGFVPSGTGARNYRTFIATDGSFRFDDATAGATRTMLTSGGNLLIGTTTDAGYKLYVSGTGTSTNLAVVGNIRAGGTGTAGGEIIASGALGNGNFVSLRHDDNNAYITVTRVVYDGHLILQPYGNVGLGTIAPGAKLDIVSTGAGSEGLRVDGAGGGFAFVVRGGSTYTSHIRAGATIGVNYFTTPPSNGLIVEGNVGIGTTSPTSGATLAVAGNILVQATNSSVFFGTGAVTYGDSSAIGRASTNGFHISGSIAGDLCIGAEFNASIRFGTGASGTLSQRMAILAGGNVAIGNENTSEVNERLNVTGNGIAIEATDGGITTLMGTFGGTDSIVGTYTNNNLQIRTNNTSRIFITSGGNVLIGTTTDSGYRLRVVGGPLNVVYGTDGSNTYLEGTSGNNTNIGFDGQGCYVETRGSSSARQKLRLQSYNGSDYTQLFIDGANQNIYTGSNVNVGIGTTSPISKQHNLITSSGTALLLNNTTGGINAYVDLDFTTYNVTVANYANAAASIRVIDDGAYSGHITFRTKGSTVNAVQGERMRIASNGNVLIGTTTDSGYKLNVAGSVIIGGGSVSTINLQLTRVSGSIAADANYYVSSNNTPNHSWIEGGYYNGELTGVVTAPNSGYPYFETYAGQGSATGKGFGFINKTSGSFTSADFLYAMSLLRTGQMRLNQYGSGTFTGTPTYNLGVDSSGNVIELPGGVVDGSGTANYVTKWSDANTVTNSQIVDNGTNVGINNASPKTKLDVNGTIGFGSKTMSMTDTFAAALTLNMNDHNGCYVKITAFGDWGNHSTIAYLGEFFVQASAGAYNEPGIIIRQVDNTGGGDDIQARILDPAGAGTRDFIIELKTTSSANTPFTAYIQYEVRGQYNSVS
jgi:hypothetical protein